MALSYDVRVIAIEKLETSAFGIKFPSYSFLYLRFTADQAIFDAHSSLSLPLQVVFLAFDSAATKIFFAPAGRFLGGILYSINMLVYLASHPAEIKCIINDIIAPVINSERIGT